MTAGYVAPTSSPHLTYRPEIDGLRAIAVLGVVLYHASLGPRGGFVGVDVFFVISGFLITSLLEKELGKSGRIDLGSFYARRVRRLLPALGIVLLATTCAAFAVLPPGGELPAALQSIAASCIFAANIFFQFTTGDYFGPDTGQLPLLHLWSLGVEEQYYLFWPLALLFFRRIPLVARRAVFVAGAVASLAFAEWAIYRGSQAAFYALPSRWWELSLGALVAWSPPLPRRYARLESVVGLFLILLSMALPTHHFPGVGALPATAGAALLLHAAVKEGVIWRTLTCPPMRLIGRISYPFYLWHWPLLAFIAILVPGGVSAQTRCEIVVAAALLAYATWRWAEQPLRGKQTRAPWKLVGATVLASAAVAILCVQLATFVAATTPAYDPASVAARDFPANAMICENRASTPAALPDPARCTLAGSTAATIAIWGDSHAMAFQPFAAALAVRRGTTALGYTRELCPPALGYDDGESPLVAERCKAFNAMVMPRMKSMDTVILAARWPRPDERHFAERLSSTLDELAPHVRRIFVIGPTPVLPARVPDCMRAGQIQRCALSRSEFAIATASTQAFLSGLSTRYPNVTYIDATSFFCGRNDCPPIRNGIPLYWDTNHVTTTAAAAFAQSFLVTRTASAL